MRGRVRVDGREWVKIRRQSAAVLQVLVDRNGAAVSKTDLHAAVWGRVAVTEDSLVQCIVEIRRALGRERNRLSTVQGMGYCLDRSEIAPEARSRASRSVAVIALAEPSLERHWQATLTGFAEDLAVDLARRGLRVIALPVEVRKEALSEFPALARALGADYLVPCRLTDADMSVRLVVQLLHGSTGEVVWAERRFMRRDDPGADVGLHAGAIAGVIGGLEGELIRFERHRLRSVGSPVNDPYELYALAGDGFETDSCFAAQAATDLAERCVALAPRFARGWLMLNWRRNRLYSHGWGDSGPDRLHREAAVFRRAAELDPRDPLALGFLAVSEAKLGDLGRARALVEAAVEAATDIPEAGAELAFPLAAVAGRPEMALRLVELSLDRHPRPLDHWGYTESRAAFLAGNNVRALAAADRSPDCLPKLVFRTLAAAALDDEPAALRSRWRLLELRPDFDFATYARDLPIADPAARSIYDAAATRLAAFVARADPRS